MTIKVSMFGTQAKEGDKFDEEVGRAHARMGQPVRIVIVNGTNAHSVHLSEKDADALIEEIKQAKLGKRGR